ncbi:fibronectin type III domain protein [Curtobacterium sp. PhB142]|uniref:fibronectin type III domain-containing protein n=1 Tax=unclassified Curtobacterium TaxID=257496 RepID=UPI0010E44988|nr:MULTISPECIES: fibronectin type III domain-containing protein [unclassified Curtobacterium]TCL87329.1 fibronectin type III domain protein [Curtobacterium sp. PhB142]TCM05322.1 fibronectin type III domain protein [Curtobacterium sp. PhB134]
MYRALITVAAAAALVIGGVAPATAAPSSSAPGAPTIVRVTGAGDSATVTWGAPKSGAKVTGWKVTIAPAQQQPGNGVDRLPAKARSDRFGDLTPKTTYRFSVRAIGAKKTGRTTLVRYTTPSVVDTTQSLFALDGSGNVVRFAEDGSGTGKVVAAKGTGFAADDVGDVFTPSADLTSILSHPADGSATRTLATGLHLTPDLRSDVAGNLYWIDSVTGAVQKLPVGSSTATTVLDLTATGSGQRFWTVTPDGKVVAVGGSQISPIVVGTGTSPRAITLPGSSGVGYPAAVLADSHGNVYVDIRSPGGAGSWAWYQLKPGATALTRIEPRLAFEYAAANADGFSLLQSAEWCSAPAEYPTSPAGCKVDRTIPDKLVVGTGGKSTVAVSGITAGSRGANTGAASDDGDVFANVDSGPSAGLWRVPASGGAAQQLSSAQYSRLLVI